MVDGKQFVSKTLEHFLFGVGRWGGGGSRGRGVGGGGFGRN